MEDIFNLVMLTAASVGALAFGTLSAYAILRAGFALMSQQRRSPAVKPQPQPATAS